MKKVLAYIIVTAFLGILIGCSGETAENTRYDMEKLMYTAGKIAERIAVQPALSSASDSTELKEAQQAILDYFFMHQNDPLVVADEKTMHEMTRMAIAAQVEMAKYFTDYRQADSVIAAYRRIGNEIPADREDIAGATLALALVYRALTVFDSTFALYDRLLTEYYPPIDSLERINTDIIAIPIDRIKIARALEDQELAERFDQQAMDYYARIKSEFPNSLLSRTAIIYTGRIYAMTNQWEMAIGQLEQLTDSTKALDIQAAVLIANIYNGPLEDVPRSIEMYRQILKRNPDSAVIATTMLRLGASLCDQEEYEEGRQVLAELKKKFAHLTNLTSRAQLYYARAFEAQDRWDRALSEFQWLMENHPYSEEAFRAALYIPEHFKSDNDQKLADIWFDRAIDFYNQAIQNQQGRPVAVAAYTFLSDTYRRLERWEEAMQSLDKIYSLTAGTRMGAQALFNAARVAYVEMEDSARAQGYLDILKQEYGTTDSADINQPDTTEINLDNIQ